jgi:hypothetical protein
MKRISATIFEFFRVGWRRLLLLIQEHAVLSLTGILFLIVMFSSVVFRLAEHDETHTVWRSIVYILSGLDLDPPETTAGRTAAAFSLFSGVLFVSLLTGVIASKFSLLVRSSQSLSRKPFKRVFSRHIILFGWSKKTEAILRELNEDYKTNPYSSEDIVVVSEQESIPRGAEEIYDHVWHVQGASTDLGALFRADLCPTATEGARAACILSGEGLPPEEADRHSLLTLLAVENLKPNALSLVEVRNPANREHFRNAYADELFDSSTLADLILARTAEYPGIAKYVDELLALGPIPDDSGGSRLPISFYVKTASECELSGKSFREAIFDHYRRTNALIVGIFSDEEIITFPDAGAKAEVPLLPEERLLLICTPEQL